MPSMSVGMTDSPQYSIGKLISDNVFHVPPYQRDYKWATEKVEQLFDDIEGAIGRGDDRYFLGLMVFMKAAEGKELIVLDGQQRLATVFLFLAACRNWMYQHDDLRGDAEKINADFMGSRRFGEEIVTPRMALNSANNLRFDKFVVKSRPVADLISELDRMKSYDRSRRLLEAAIYCHERIAALAETMSHQACAAHLSKILNYLKEAAPVVSMTVADERAAFTIFETLNDRGMDLSPLDLVKNHLFRCLGNNDTLQRDLEGRWGQMMGNLETAAPDQFLKAFWTSRHGRVQAHDLFGKFVDFYGDREGAVNVSMDMLTASERYAAMSNAEDPVWASYNDVVRDHVRSLHTLAAQQTIPVVLAALERFDAAEMERLLWMLEVLIVRYQFVGGGRTGSLEIECAKVAHGIYERRINDTTAAFRELKTVYPTDEQFNGRFREMRKATAAKTIYLLKRLDLEAQRQATGQPLAGGQFDVDLSIEHVYPQNPGDEWPKEMAEDDDELATWLGNLCLLRRGANRALGRQGFARKKQMYSESGIHLTRTIASENDNWDRKAILKRQNYLAELAEQAWRFQ
jgi:Protein of unknown function DUF262/Protein of unknown function (DUF1524)